MSNVHFVTQNVSIEHFRDISTDAQRELSTRMPDEQMIGFTFSFGNRPNCHLIRYVLSKLCFVRSNYNSRTFKFLSYVRHLFVYALLLQIPDAGSSNIRDELAEPISRLGTRQAYHRT
jgi:hypothetical protein